MRLTRRGPWDRCQALNNVFKKFRLNFASSRARSAILSSEIRTGRNLREARLQILFVKENFCTSGTGGRALGLGPRGGGVLSRPLGSNQLYVLSHEHSCELEAWVDGVDPEIGVDPEVGPDARGGVQRFGNEAVSYTHLTLPTNREV